MRKVLIENFCDFCWQEDKTEVPATTTIVVAMALGSSKLSPAKEIEVCDNHGGLLTRVAFIYERAPDLPGQPRTNGGAATAHGDSPRTRPVEERSPSLQPVECPICPAVLSARGGLIGHIWTQHRTDTRPPAPRGKCPDCSRAYPTVTGLAIHRTRHHGYSALLEALAGVPGWNALKAERWEAGLGVE